MKLEKKFENEVVEFSLMVIIEFFCLMYFIFIDKRLEIRL